VEESCPINIDERGQRQRFTAGAIALALGLAFGLYAMWMREPRAIRALAAAPLFFGFLCLLQARTKTCVKHALRGTKAMGDSVEPVADAGEAEEAGCEYYWAFRIVNNRRHRIVDSLAHGAG
jgi:hypothetical protein